MSNKFDAQLHLLRSTGRYLGASNLKAQHDVEGARFNVFAAIEAKDYDRARTWLRSLEMAIISATADRDDYNTNQMSKAAFEAINEIRDGLREKED